LIQFQKVTFKNFLSYGNTKNEFEFRQGINRFNSRIGSGKSSIFEALYFGLFGKPYRDVNLAQLVNTINNKDLQVEVYFTNQNHSYIIERGIKPNYLRVYKDGHEPSNLIPVPSTSRSYQQIIEEDILQQTPNIFDQVSIKSLTKEMSFLKLKKADRREIVENVLDIKIFTDMNKLCKNKVDALAKEIELLQKDINYKEILINQEFENLKRLKAIKDAQAAKMLANISEIETEIAGLQREIEDKQNGINKLQKYKERKIDLTNRLKTNEALTRELKSKESDIDNQITLNQNKVKFLKSTCGDCPKITEVACSTNIESLETDKAVVVAGLGQNDIILKKLLKDINECDQYLMYEAPLAERIRTNTRLIEEKQKVIRNSQIENAKIVLDDTKYLQLKAGLKTSTDAYNKKSYDKKHFVFTRTLLTDEAVKAHVVKKYLPSINTLLNVNLDIFDVGFSFEFDEEFQEVIKTRHKEKFTYESFSSGQKRSIDLAVLFMFINFCKIKYPKANTNLLILDEVSSGLDGATENILFTLLKEMALKDNKCIIVISHNLDLNIENINYLYDVKFQGGFSTLIEKEL